MGDADDAAWMKCKRTATVNGDITPESGQILRPFYFAKAPITEVPRLPRFCLTMKSTMCKNAGRRPDVKRATWLISILAAACFFTDVSAKDPGHWMPDAATVERIEHYAKDHMPIRNDSDRAGPINTYARYYTGSTMNSRKVVIGQYVSTTLNEPAGIHIVPWSKLPNIMDGGCFLVDLWFDVQTDRVIAIACHGVA